MEKTQLLWLNDSNNGNGVPANCIALINAVKESVDGVTYVGLARILQFHDTLIMSASLRFGVSQAFDGEHVDVNLEDLVNNTSDLPWSTGNSYPFVHGIIQELGVELVLLKVSIKGTTIYLIAWSN